MLLSKNLSMRKQEICNPWGIFFFFLTESELDPKFSACWPCDLKMEMT